MNPRAAINDLHPFQGCPFGQLGYFSELKTNIKLKSGLKIRIKTERVGRCVPVARV